MLKVENFGQTTKLLVCLFIDCLGTGRGIQLQISTLKLWMLLVYSSRYIIVFNDQQTVLKKAIYTWRKKGFGHNEKGTIVSSSSEKVTW